MLRRVLADLAATLSHRSLLMLLGAGLFAQYGDRAGLGLTYYFFTFFWAVQLDRDRHPCSGPICSPPSAPCPSPPSSRAGSARSARP
ncbi:MAG: hypothetical protein WDN69_31715 [Aliidongia sp.]